ncbi:hypothetical protein Tco_0558669 [Tanacetum coccineum]
MIEADEQLAARLQAEEQEQFSIKEKSRMLVEMIAERKNFFAAKRAVEQRSKPPTKTHIRNIICAYVAPHKWLPPETHPMCANNHHRPLLVAAVALQIGVATAAAVGPAQARPSCQVVVNATESGWYSNLVGCLEFRSVSLCQQQSKSIWLCRGCKELEESRVSRRNKHIKIRLSLYPRNGSEGTLSLKKILEQRTRRYANQVETTEKLKLCAASLPSI